MQYFLYREERRGTHMGTFMDSIQDFDMSSLPKTEKVKSLAGSKYLEHLSEINSRIEEIWKPTGKPASAPSGSCKRELPLRRFLFIMLSNIS